MNNQEVFRNLDHVHAGAQYRYTVDPCWFNLFPGVDSFSSNMYYVGMERIDGGRVFFYMLLFVTLIVAYFLLGPYIGLIVFALVIVTVFKPVYDFFTGVFKKRTGFSVFFTIAVIYLTVLVPLMITAFVVVQQVGQLVQDISGTISLESMSLESILETVNSLIRKIPGGSEYTVSQTQVTDWLRNIIEPAAKSMYNTMLSVGTSYADIVTRFIIFTVVLATMFPGFDYLLVTFKRVSPLSDELDRIYMDRITAMTKAMVIGVFFIAMIQGGLAGVFFLIGGVPYAGFWTILAIVFSIIPLGANTVAVPLGLIMIASGDVWQGLVVMLGSVVIVSNIDNIIRPNLVPREAQLNPALVLLSAFGGLHLFGALGVIYGPVTMIFLLTTLDVYLDYYPINKKSAAAKHSPDIRRKPKSGASHSLRRRIFPGKKRGRS